MVLTRIVFLLKVSNNVGILPEEDQRIQERISKARSYNDLSEVFENHGDESEGAGLGLAMSLLMLKNEGIEGDSYRIKSEEGITSAYIKIPFEFKKRNINLQKTGDIFAELDTLPTFPDNINQIMSLINKPDSSIQNITELVSRDVSLSTNILKLANSASFSQRARVEDLEDAIKVIGLSELNNILLSLGTKNSKKNTMNLKRFGKGPVYPRLSVDVLGKEWAGKNKQSPFWFVRLCYTMLAV